MELEISDNNTIYAHINSGEKCFLTATTTDYNCDGNCSVTIGTTNDMIDLGWSNLEDIKAINNLEIGQRYDSPDYCSTAFIIRLG